MRGTSLTAAGPVGNRRPPAPRGRRRRNCTELRRRDWTERRGLVTFLTEDSVLGTIGIGQSFNLRSYAWNGPLRFVDLDGRAEVCLSDVICASEGDIDLCSPLPTPGFDGCAFGDEDADHGTCLSPPLNPLSVCEQNDRLADLIKSAVANCLENGAFGAGIGFIAGGQIPEGAALGCAAGTAQTIGASVCPSCADEIDAFGKSSDVAEFLCTLPKIRRFC